MSDIDSIGGEPTLSIDPADISTPTDPTPDEGSYPREVFEARAKLAALAANPTGDPALAPVTDEPAAEPDASTDEESQALKDLKAKYGGDLNKAAEAIWESNREQSRMAETLAAMQSSIEALREERQTAIPEFDPQPADVPSGEDLQFVTDDIATFESDIKDADTRMSTILDRSDDLKAQINRAEGRAEASEDPDQKARLQSELDRLVSKYNTEAEKFQAAKAEKQKAERALKSSQRDKTTIERRIETERQQLIKAQSDNRAKLAEQGQTFNTSVKAAFQATGLPASEEPLYGETLTAKVSAYLRSLGNAPALTTEALVKVTEQEAAKLAKLHGLGQRTAFAAASATKLANNAALRAAPTVPGAVAGNKPPVFKSAEEEANWTKSNARARLAAAASRGRQA